MSWFSKPKPQPEPQDGDTPAAHAKVILSTKPPHNRIRSERCDCAHGQARGGCTAYENPA